MTGTASGYAKVREKMIQRLGSEQAYLEWKRESGRIGGRIGNTGGFAANHELARIAGAKAGKLSKRGHKYQYTKNGYNYYIALDTGNVVKYKHEDTTEKQRNYY